MPLPVTSETVARETRRDPVLARVHECIVKGWSAHIDGDKPYYERRNELTEGSTNLQAGFTFHVSKLKASEGEDGKVSHS